MAKEFSRTQRVADAIQRSLASVIQQELQDPRLRLVTVTAVTVSRDLAYAKVFITKLTEVKEEINIVLKTLNKAAPFLRHRLAEEMDLRIVPQLNFVFDESISHGAHLSGLIDQAILSDEKKQK